MHDIDTPYLQVFTIFMLVAGTPAIIYFVGSFLEPATQGENERAIEDRRKTQGIEKQRDHVIICGHERMRQILARELRHQSACCILPASIPYEVEAPTVKRLLSLGLLTISAAAMAADDAAPYLGRWALTIPGGGAGWLGVTQEKGYLDSSILWGGGSVVPTASTYIEDGKLYVTRLHEVERKDADGNVVRKQTYTETIVAEVDGDKMSLQRHEPSRTGMGSHLASFEGVRIPDLPEKPDLKKVKFGEPIELLEENSLDGWTLTNDRQTNGWEVKDGVLTNNAVQPEGKHVSFGNLRTVDEFEDFNLKLEVNVPQGSNSGIYLRGIYEVQVLDSYNQPLDSHNMGAIYSRITPTVSAEKPFGEWQSLDITLVDRHVTVVLNGTTIIDNEPLLGCTGGAMWSDEFRPGPLYLQGDHGVVSYRNIVLTPVKG